MGREIENFFKTIIDGVNIVEKENPRRADFSMGGHIFHELFRLLGVEDEKLKDLIFIAEMYKDLTGFVQDEINEQIEKARKKSKKLKASAKKAPAKTKK